MLIVSATSPQASAILSQTVAPASQPSSAQSSPAERNGLGPAKSAGMAKTDTITLSPSAQQGLPGTAVDKSKAATQVDAQTAMAVLAAYAFGMASKADADKALTILRSSGAVVAAAQETAMVQDKAAADHAAAKSADGAAKSDPSGKASGPHDPSAAAAKDSIATPGASHSDDKSGDPHAHPQAGQNTGTAAEPSGQASVGQASVGQVSVDQASASQVSASQVSALQASAQASYAPAGGAPAAVKAGAVFNTAA